MSAVFEAHQRLLALLPVRTHEQRHTRITHGLGCAEEKPAPSRRERIRELIANGVKKRHLASLLGISRTAVQKHLRAIKLGK